MLHAISPRASFITLTITCPNDWEDSYVLSVDGRKFITKDSMPQQGFYGCDVTAVSNNSAGLGK